MEPSLAHAGTHSVGAGFPGSGYTDPRRALGRRTPQDAPMTATTLTRLEEAHTVTLTPDGDRVIYRSYYRSRLQVENRLRELDARRTKRDLLRDGWVELRPWN